MYKKAELELVTFAVEDVIVTSGGSNPIAITEPGDPVDVPPGNEDAPEPE